MLPQANLEPPMEAAGSGPPSLAARAVALLEVVLCSDYPTQLALASIFAVLGYRPSGPDGQLLAGYVAMLSLVDTALLIALILLFLRAHGERPGAVLFGWRSVAGEARLGLPLTVVALGLGIGILAFIQRFLPTLHTVAHNPLEQLIRRPRDVWLFALVVVVAGGVREEIQRAFVLHRFEGWLGGGRVGIVIASLAFGAGHLLQGADAAIATGALGAFWGVVYLRRRSIAAPVVSHSGFNLIQIVQFLVFGR